MDKDSIELSVLAKQFELYNRTEGKSQATIDWYNLALKQLYGFLNGEERPAILAELGEVEVRQFILYLQGRNRWQENPYVLNRQGKLKAISIQTYIRALKAFFNWMYKEGFTPENRLVKLKPPKAPIKVVEILTQNEIAKVLGHIDRDSFAGARDYAILLLFLDTGLRCGELRNAILSDTNIESGYLKVMGKGSKERIVPFGAVVQKVLLRYVLHFRPEPFNPAIINLFLTLDGKPLTKNSVKMIFQRIAAKSGVKRLHPHLCRHTFATNYLINGGDVFSLQQILGHTTLEMVRRYITLASAQVTVAHRKFSPMDRLNIPTPNVSSLRNGGKTKPWSNGRAERTGS